MASSLYEALILSSSLSIDSFIAGFAYGSNKIKMPFSSVQIISFICSSVVGFSMLAGSIIRDYLPARLTAGICFAVLFFMGFIKLVDDVMKAFIRRHTNLAHRVEFSMFSIRFILALYADPEQSDADHSKSISAAEAVSLSLALSLDGLAVGFGAALGNISGWTVFFGSLVANTILLLAGYLLGEKITRRARFSLSWIGGVLLMGIAFLKLLSAS